MAKTAMPAQRGEVRRGGDGRGAVPASGDEGAEVADADLHDGVVRSAIVSQRVVVEADAAGRRSTTAMVAGTAPAGADASSISRATRRLSGRGRPWLMIVDSRATTGRPCGERLGDLGVDLAGACGHAIAATADVRRGCPATSGHYGGSVTTGPERVALAPAHWEADVPVRDGRTVRDPADHPGRRRPARGVPPVAVGRDGLLPLLRALSRARPSATSTASPTSTTSTGSRSSRRWAASSSASAATTASTRATPRWPSSSRDDHQGRGLGSVLLEHLAAAARERGVRRFVAEVLPDEPADALDLRGGRLPPEPQDRGRRGQPRRSTSARRSPRSRSARRASTARRR